MEPAERPTAEQLMTPEYGKVGGARLGTPTEESKDSARDKVIIARRLALIWA